MKAAYKSNDPAEVRRDYDDLAAEIIAAEAQYAELGAKLTLMKETHGALGRHLARLTNKNVNL
jgi:hypothetical protein